MKILILCTGNSCRSQMAEGFIKSFNPDLTIISAGTHPEKEINPYAVRAMKEIGIDLSGHYPKTVDQFSREAFDYVITVCDNARMNCPVFTGSVGKRLHIGFEDPALARGTDEEKMTVYRKIRDQIGLAFLELYKNEMKEKLRKNI